MLIDFLWQNMERIGSIASVKVSDLQGTSPVLTVQEDTKAIVAFREMANSGVSGLAVLDSNGKLVDNISLRDLKVISKVALDSFFRVSTRTQKSSGASGTQ
jgi:CBS domain-containing protein